MKHSSRSSQPGGDQFYVKEKEKQQPMFCVRQLFLLSLCFILKVITLNTKAGETTITHTRLRCIALKLKIVDKYISDILFLFPFSNYQTVRLTTKQLDSMDKEHTKARSVVLDEEWDTKVLGLEN